MFALSEGESNLLAAATKLDTVIRFFKCSGNEIMSSERVFYKLDIQGIVYLVDPATGKAHTYDLTHPTEIGQVIWSDAKAQPRIRLHDDWRARMAAKVAQAGLTVPDLHTNADNAKTCCEGPGPVESTVGGASAGTL